MECPGCGEHIDEEFEAIASDYIGETWHKHCLDEETE